MSWHSFGRSRRAASLMGVCLAAGLCCGLPAAANTLVPCDQGSVWTSTQTGPPPPACNPGSILTHDPASTVMLVGLGSISGGCSSSFQQNAYVLFNVPGGWGPIQSAVVAFDLSVQLYPGDQFSWHANDVSSPPAAFQIAYAGPPTAPGIALMNDLGTGLAYGSGVTPGSGAFSFELAGEGLANLAAAQGGVFAIGFSGGPGLGYSARSATLSNLRIEVSVVPEVRSSVLMVGGLLGVACLARRRRAQATFAGVSGVGLSTP